MRAGEEGDELEEAGEPPGLWSGDISTQDPEGDEDGDEMPIPEYSRGEQSRGDEEGDEGLECAGETPGEIILGGERSPLDADEMCRGDERLRSKAPLEAPPGDKNFGGSKVSQ